MSVLYENYLAHHGVKDQKWGVRRYQNEDGSLTEEGKSRNKENNNEPDIVGGLYKAETDPDKWIIGSWSRDETTYNFTDKDKEDIKKVLESYNNIMRKGKEEDEDDW